MLIEIKCKINFDSKANYFGIINIEFKKLYIFDKHVKNKEMSDFNTIYAEYGHKLRKKPGYCSDCGHGLVECEKCGKVLHEDGYDQNHCQLFYPTYCTK